MALRLLQFGFVYLPFMQAAFGSGPLGLRHWLVPLSVGPAVFLIAKGEKALARKRKC